MVKNSLEGVKTAIRKNIMNTNLKCKNCQSQFVSSWFQQKGDYSKLSKAGYSPIEIKKILPICSKCIKNLVKTEMRV